MLSARLGVLQVSSIVRLQVLTWYTRGWNMFLVVLLIHEVVVFIYANRVSTRR